jgi:hypothetical protein
MKTVKEILIDTSSSMGEFLPGNKKKMDLAKEILIEKIIPFISDSDTIGIRLFGGRCNMVGALQNIPNANIKRLTDFIRYEIPLPNGSTPLALAIKTSVDNLKNYPNAIKEIYLVTDGEETCGGDIKSAADYAASNDIKCKIHIVAIGELTDTAKQQFEYITSRTGGKNINIGTKSTSHQIIAKEFADFFETDLDSFSDCVDNEYDIKSEQLIRNEVKNIRDFICYKQLPVNYIPSLYGGTCQKLLVVEYYNDDDGLNNLLQAIEHIENCGITNKEVLILMKKWDDTYYTQFFKSWVKQFKSRGVDKVCVKIDGFKSYKEL